MANDPNHATSLEASATADCSRRDILKATLAVLSAAGASAPGSAAAAPANAASALRHAGARSPSVRAKDDGPVVETMAGKVIGYVRNGINVFKGVPYGDTTEGANRFRPAAKPKPWPGVRSSRQFGNVAPQGPRAGWASDETAFMFSWDDGVQGENCLRVNVWTPAVNDGKRRPVMVWLHGGGYTAGSGQELLSYDGENLARRGDVVVVTLNHRLNVFGFLDLSQYGRDYASSANIGMLDIVAALEWVRDNITGFGGDPSTVTVFGQSGGGGKVSMLMGMPSAKGLFHRGIVESGSTLRGRAPERSQELADYIVAELGLNKSTLAEIHTLPYQRILHASLDALKRHTPATPGAAPDIRRLADALGFSPVVDGKVLPAHPFDPVASRLSADVPMIVGTTLNEFITAIGHPEYESMSAAELEQRVHEMFGDAAPGVLAAFRQRTPEETPFQLWSRIAASGMRGQAVAQARAKAALGAAPAYLYWFAWQTPILNGRPGAFHCSEIAFAFYNTDRCENMTGGGADARALAGIVSDAWIQFARSGDPNHPNMPRWPAYTDRDMPTMIFDNPTRMVAAPDRAELASIPKA